jgi:hydroxymethylbilane synthase
LNRNTRLAKLDAEDGPYAALILAKAGLVRLGMGHRITADVKPPALFHAVSQGALGVEIRAGDEQALELCKRITHQPTQWKCMAERSCLRVLEGGCSVPVGVTTTLEEYGADGGVLTFTACVTALDGSKHVEHTLKETICNVAEAEAIGERMARKLLESGAEEILAAINKDRESRIEMAKATESA